MPTIPAMETSQSIFSTGTLAPQQIDATAASFGGQTAQAGQQLGAAGMSVAGDINQMAMRQKAIEDETNVNDQYYKSTFPAITAATQSYLKMQGKDAVDNLPGYQDQLEQIRVQQREQLPNPQQQKMFDNLTRKTIAFNVDGAARHATQQNQVYEDQTSAGMVSAAGQLAVQHWNDPVGFNIGLQSGINEIMTHSQFRGQPVEYGLKQVRDFTGSTYSNRLMEMANTDPTGAYDLFRNGETYTDQTGQHQVNIQAQIDPAVLPALEGHLLAGAKNQYASVISHGAIYGGKVPDPALLYPAIDGAPPLEGAVKTMESNGKEFGPDGKILTSPAGAQGSMQVMPTTQSNPGYGVTPAKDSSPAELARVGRDYLGAMTAKYQDPALTLAAYNAGPGMVDDWLAGTNKTGKNPSMTQIPDPRTGAISSTDFAAKIPFSETRAYVGKGLSMTQQAGDKPTALPTTAELKTQLPTIAENARQNALRMYPNDPAFADSVASRTLNQGNTVLQGVTSQENAARDTLTRMMIGTKPDGSDRATSMDQLLATPAGKAAWSQATPEVQQALQQTLSNPANVPMTKQGFDTYYQLKGQAASDPNTFVKQDLSTLYGKIPLAQIMDLSTTQAGLMKANTTQTDKMLNWSRTKGDVDDMLKPLGLGNIAKTGTDHSKQTEVFYGKLQEAAESYHDQTKKYPDTTTVRKMAASLLTQGTQGEDHWYSRGNKIAAFQSPDLSQFKAGVPDDQKPALQQQFQNVYHRPPTDSELTDLYTRFQLSKKGGK